jgi:hypothetical protein
MAENPCGHTDEEHENQLRYLMQQLAKGDISVLVPRLSNDNLELLLQAAATEIMVRSMTLEAARRNWNDFHQMVTAIYLVDDVMDSISPEHYEDVERGRLHHTAQVEAYDFQQAVESGLESLFEQHGETHESS